MNDRKTNEIRRVPSRCIFVIARQMPTNLDKILYMCVLLCVYYSEEKAKLLRRITTKIEEKNQELRCVCFFEFSSHVVVTLQ